MQATKHILQQKYIDFPSTVLNRNAVICRYLEPLNVLQYMDFQAIIMYVGKLYYINLYLSCIYSFIHFDQHKYRNFKTEISCQITLFNLCWSRISYVVRIFYLSDSLCKRRYETTMDIYKAILNSFNFQIVYKLSVDIYSKFKKTQVLNIEILIHSDDGAIPLKKYKIRC